VHHIGDLAEDKMFKYRGQNVACSTIVEELVEAVPDDILADWAYDSARRMIRENIRRATIVDPSGRRIPRFGSYQAYVKGKLVWCAKPWKDLTKQQIEWVLSYRREQMEKYSEVTQAIQDHCNEYHPSARRWKNKIDVKGI
jgi:hypothetical protein